MNKDDLFYLSMGTVANMTKMKQLISRERPQYLVLFGLSVGAAGLTGAMYCFGNISFQRFIGGINPLATLFFIILLGVISLSFLLSRWWFAIYKKENLKGLFWRSSLAAPFALMTIWVDLKTIFPADTNVLFPQSLLFYPAMGFFAEILFHVAPLALLIFLTSIFKNIRYKNILWVCILIVSLFEPIYQTIPMVSSGHFPLWATGTVLFNLILFSLFQLIIFMRHDFVSMYSLRLVYYMIWHLVWGHIRMRVLF